MTLPEAYRLFAYWDASPPEHELASLFARVYTTWRPEGAMTEEDHRASLEARWKAGAMNPRQFFEATGGRLALDAGRADGARADPADMPGIGRFPGAVH